MLDESALHLTVIINRFTIQLRQRFMLPPIFVFILTANYL